MADESQPIRTTAGPDPSTRTPSFPSVEEGRFPAGTTLAGRFRILGLLGQGGMGEVYRALDLTLNQPVALKFIARAEHGNEASLAVQERSPNRPPGVASERLPRLRHRHHRRPAISVDGVRRRRRSRVAGIIMVLVLLRGVIRRTWLADGLLVVIVSSRPATAWRPADARAM